VPTSEIPAFVTPVPQLNTCTSTQIAAFVTACASATATTTTCNAWFADTTNTTCIGCIEPTANGSPTNSGASLTDAAGTSFNVEGCIALTDPVNGTACAQALTPVQECDDAACADCAGSTDANLQTCSTTAESSGGACVTYIAGANAACASDFVDGGADTTCNDPTYLVNLFCGTGS
jgi:hypothetical protein